MKRNESSKLKTGIFTFYITLDFTSKVLKHPTVTIILFPKQWKSMKKKIEEPPISSIHAETMTRLFPWSQPFIYICHSYKISFPRHSPVRFWNASSLFFLLTSPAWLTWHWYSWAVWKSLIHKVPWLILNRWVLDGHMWKDISVLPVLTTEHYSAQMYTEPSHEIQNRFPCSLKQNLCRFNSMEFKNFEVGNLGSQIRNL